jgi:hypothetical protein
MLSLFKTGKAEFTYKIGKRKFVQQPIVSGQHCQLVDILSGAAQTLATTSSIAVRLYQAIAVIITPEKMLRQDKDIAQLANEIQVNIDDRTMGRIIKDFIKLNPSFNSSLFLSLSLESQAEIASATKSIREVQTVELSGHKLEVRGILPPGLAGLIKKQQR